MPTTILKFARAVRFALLLLPIVLVASCATSSPTRYFQLDVQLEIDQIPYDVAYNWRCKEVLDGPNFGPGRILKSKWVQSLPTYTVLKKAKNDAVVLFTPPHYCGDDVEKLDSAEPFFTGGIIFVDSAIRPSSLEIYTKNRTKSDAHEVRIIFRKIRLLDKAVPDYVPSREEKVEKNILRENSHGYQTVLARIIPESIWKSDKQLAAEFQGAKGILLAPFSPDEKNQNNFFPGQDILGKGVNLDDYTVSLSKVGDQWEMTENSKTSFALRFMSLNVQNLEGKAAGGNIGNVQVIVNYGGVMFEVQSSREIFDAKKHLLIQFVNEYQPYPWIGPQE